GQNAGSVIAVFGSATSEGEVADQVISVFGNTRITGAVGDQAVAVFGNIYVNGKVGDQVIAVFGNVELGPDAEVNDVVAVGGRVTRDPKAIVRGQVNNVSFGAAFTDFGWLQAWIQNCAFYLRPLAFAPGLMWAWWIAVGFLAFYVVLALLFGKGVTRCVVTLEQRPGYSILAALLAVFLAPVAMMLLAITGVGLAIIPFLASGLFFASLFGKVVMLAWLGRRLARFIGSDLPAMAVLIGGTIVLFLYTVPVFGLILYKLLGWIGLGVVVYTLLSGMKREQPAVPPVIPPVSGATPSDPTGPGLLVPAPAMPVSPATTLLRAGFWIRMAALLIDLMLVGMLGSFLNGVTSFGSHVHIRSDLLPALAVYGALMWKLRGTTVGGIVCGLKVVRLDDRPVDWGTAIVRALACFLSLMVLGLGFLWVIFDDQRQSWHDKIAGTTVVRVPKGVSLV
ncbi:MAG: RDD family protein, partial [Opitutaceae bacterium]